MRAWRSAVCKADTDSDVPSDRHGPEGRPHLRFAGQQVKELPGVIVQVPLFAASCRHTLLDDRQVGTVLTSRHPSQSSSREQRGEDCTLTPVRSLLIPTTLARGGALRRPDDLRVLT